MSIDIVKVTSKHTLEKFINFPAKIYKNNPLWIPPLKKDEWKSLYTPIKEKEQNSSYFLALVNEVIVGRIAVINLENEFSEDGEKIGRFGWFDFIDEIEVVSKLTKVAEEWCRTKEIKILKGPMGFTNLDKTGILIEGFDEDPTIVENYNHSYYAPLLDKIGYSKAADWISYEFEVPAKVPEKLRKYSEIVMQRYKVKLVRGKFRDKKPYGLQIFHLINETHKHIHGFIPFDDETAQNYLKRYFPLLDSDMVSLVIDESDKLVGYGISMPSFSNAFRKARGKLFPFGYLEIFKALRKNKKADLYLIGIASHMRNKGLIALIFQDIMTAFIRKGIKKVESNPELETNHEVQTLWKNYEYRQHKRRRIYQKRL